MDECDEDDVRPFDKALARLARDGALHDSSDADPAALIAPLREAGLFHDVLPPPWGYGLATDPGRTDDLYDVLRRIGAASLSAGRLFEGHVNAIKLVFTFGPAAQQHEAADAVSNGALMGVWNAETPPGVTYEHRSSSLRGSKIYASGVGLIDRPLITARNAAGEILMTTPKAAKSAPYDLSGWRMRGMRTTATGTVHLDGVRVEDDEIIGAPGDYYRSPGFRGGAWRFAAVQFGALEEIARLARQGVQARGRASDPHQKARIGRMEMAVETARLITRRAARLVESPYLVEGEDGDAAKADAYAGMARLVVERSSLEVIELAERALGLMAFAEAERIERLVRDLATYLRQPFPDTVLEGIGAWALGR